MDQQTELDAIYDANAEYYDAVSAPRAAMLSDALTAWALRQPTEGSLVDLGAGTGRLTVALARAVPGRSVYAVEPSRAMRAVLAGRLADDDDLRRRVTVVPLPIPAAWAQLPDTVAGVAVLGVLAHLRPEARAGLLTEVSARLQQGATALVELMRPWTAEAIPRQTFATVQAGHHRIVGEMEAVPVGGDGLEWTMRYRRVANNDVSLQESSGSVSCWVLGPERFVQEAAQVGLGTEWRSAELAELRPGTMSRFADANPHPGGGSV